MPPPSRHRYARPLGAAGIGGAGVLLLHAGAAAWPIALLGGAGAAVFAGRRSLGGVFTAYGLLLGTSFAAMHRAPALPATVLAPLAVLELYGLLTLAAAALSSRPRHISRRLLGAWLASSGAVTLGLALCAGTATIAAGSVLVAGGLAYRLGVVPAFAWAPLLLRHPSARVAALGAGAFVGTFAALLHVTPLLPDPAAAGRATALLSAITAPWALWHAVRQWRSDPRCARSYGAVLGAACALTVYTLTSRHLTIRANLH